MRAFLVIATFLCLLSDIAWAGDEFLTPKLLTSMAFDSSAPRYKSIGVEVRGAERTLFVVADPVDVLSQAGVNRIVRDVRKRSPEVTSITFYTSVLSKPSNPSFAIYDHLAIYVVADNRTYFGVAAKKLYGSWAHGPGR
jgi:hypothetical protein